MQRANADENTYMFELLWSQKDQIEESFGDQLIWAELPERKACRVQYAKAVDGYDEDNWPFMIEWLEEHIIRLENAFKSPLKNANDALKKRTPKTSSP
jgi:hypothetical protein